MQKTKKNNDIEEYFKIILNKSINSIVRLFTEIGIKYNHIISLEENFLNAYIFIAAGIDNFNDDIYLDLNQDVLVSNMNPKIHFLKFGIKEARKWKKK